MIGTEDREASPASPSPPFKTGPKPSEARRFLKAGAGSVLLHIILIAALVLCLQSGLTKEDSQIYKVTIRPLSSTSVPEETPVKQEKKKPAQEAKRAEPVKEVKGPVLVVEEEKVIPELIPFPVVLNKEPLPQKEERAVEPPSALPERKVVLLETASSEGSGGPGKGPGGGGNGSGPGGGTGEGLKGGDQSSGFATSGKGSGTGPGGFGRGSGKGSGDGSGDGSGGGVSKLVIHNAKKEREYPKEAKAKGYEGEVLLRVEFLSNGKVGRVELKKTSGHKILDQSALAEAKQLEFTPIMKGNVPVDAWKDVPFEYKLK